MLRTGRLASVAALFCARSPVAARGSVKQICGEILFPQIPAQPSSSGREAARFLSAASEYREQEAESAGVVG